MKRDFIPGWKSVGAGLLGAISLFLLTQCGQASKNEAAHAEPPAPEMAPPPEMSPGVPEPVGSGAPPPIPLPNSAPPETMPEDGLPVRGSETATPRIAMANGGGEDKPTKEYHEVPVFYATDRKPKNSAVPGERYGVERHREGGPLEYGKAVVSIPFIHKTGVIERPAWWKLEFSEDPKKHVVVTALDKLDAAAFYGSVSEAATAASQNQALVFIHGFNVPFAAAIRRTAQVTYDLNFPGVALAYSWPSQGNLAAYTVDEDNAVWTVPHLVTVLTDLRKNTQVDKIHIVAHSMGTRVLTEALAVLHDRGEDLKLSNIILAAPDIDADVFTEQILPKIRTSAERMTMYASSADEALVISRKINGNNRLGLSDPQVLVALGIDSVDASGIDTSLLGHGYFGETKKVLQDLLGLVIEGKAPTERELTPGQHGEWKFASP